MKNALTVLLVLCSSILILPKESLAEPWPQFRGPGGAGVSTDAKPLPAEVAPDRNVLWSIDLAPGVSSPVVHGDRLYLTAEKDGPELVTMAINTRNGRVVWETAAPLGKIEKTDKSPKGRLATPSAATDGQRVVVFFGSSGLLCYDTNGKQIWHRKMGPFHNKRGATSSPIIVDGKVLLVEDHEVDSFLAAFDVQTGRTLWKTDRALFNRSYGTPVVWRQGETKYVVAVGSGLITAYELDAGKPAFFVQGTSCVANPTPVVGDDGTLYVASANPGPKREFQLTFADLLDQRGENRDGRLTRNELPSGLFTAIFPDYDRDDSSDLSASEYAAIQRLMGTSTKGMIALRPGGTGINRTKHNLLWHIRKSTPRTASPVYKNGHLYMINDGGVFVSVDAKTGKAVRAGRSPAKGKFFGSPVLGDGKVYFASDRGELTVITATPEWKVLSSADFGEPIYPTPAICDGRLFVRTESRLFCFGAAQIE